MTTKRTAKHRSAVLYNGSVLYINQTPGGTWVVDVFGEDNIEDLVYHATYATEDEALDDLASWKRWED